MYKTFVITISSYDENDNIIKSLKEKTFTGYFSIESENTVLLKRKIINGKDEISISKSKNLDVENLFIDESGSCSLRTVHDCVSFKIVDMNFVEYSLCCLGAPACYGGLWAACTWDVCIMNKTYVNPIKKSIF